MSDRTTIVAEPISESSSIQTSKLASASKLSFEGKDVQHLRCALGQSRADFARVFGVNWEVVMQWELGERTPTLQQLSTLIRLSQQAEAFAEKTMIRPALEVALKERKLDQIHESEVRLDPPIIPGT